MLARSGELSVLAGVEQQRGEIGSFGEALDTANEDGVVAADVGGFVGDLEHRAATGENRGAAGAGLPGQADETVGRPSGEAIGKIDLIGSEDVDRVVAGTTKGFETIRAVVEAPEHQRRIERDGGEGIDGQADRPAVGIECCDDGDPGGKAPQGIAQRSGRDGGVAHGEYSGDGKKPRIIRPPAVHVEAEFD